MQPKYAHPTPLLKAAFLTATLSLLLNATAWALFLLVHPIKPSTIALFSATAACALAGAILLGILAAVRGRKEPSGLFLALLFVMLLLPSCLMTALLAGPPGESIEYQWRSVPQNNFRLTAEALRDYADAHDQFPRSLNLLIDGKRLTPDTLRDPFTGTPFEYLAPNLPANCPTEIIILATTPVPERNGRWLAFADGHIEFVDNTALPNTESLSTKARNEANLPPAPLK